MLYAPTSREKQAAAREGAWACSYTRVAQNMAARGRRALERRSKGQPISAVSARCSEGQQEREIRSNEAQGQLALTPALAVCNPT
eukprot:10879080-Alexandrium_andersonii.AAC.1